MIKVHQLETSVAGRKPDPSEEGAAVPLVHSSTVATWVDFLESVGADVETGMAGANLSPDSVGSSDTYVPCRSLCSWAAHEGREQGLDNIGLQVADRAGADGLPPGVLAAVARSATLHQGLKVLCEEVTRASSHVKIWLLDRPEAVYICHTGSFSREVEGQVELTWWTLGTLIHVVRLFLGNDWQPSMMGVPTQAAPGAFAAEMLPKTRFVGEMERAWVAVPRRRLGESLQTIRRFRADELPKPPDGFVESLTCALRPLLAAGRPGIESAARLTGMTVRTLQRRLRSHGRTYSGVLDEVCWLAATELLREPANKVIDVAFETGYEDPSHFSRAFRRIGGVSPGEYRRAIAGELRRAS